MQTQDSNDDSKSDGRQNVSCKNHINLFISIKRLAVGSRNVCITILYRYIGIMNIIVLLSSSFACIRNIKKTGKMCHRPAIAF